MSRWLKGGIVTVGAVIFSTVAINASDVFRGIDGSLSGLVLESTGPCGDGASLLQLQGGALCVDTYEASPGDSCDIADPKSEVDTQVNMNTGSCTAVSEPDRVPWRFVSLTQAQQLCARAGKRLLTNEEWYQAVLGMGDMSMCVTDAKSSPHNTGAAQCTTPAGIHDMVGNVWEWVDGEVVSGTYNDTELPPSGYVALVDSDGVVLETTNSPQAEFGADYAWTGHTGTNGMIRGGFYGSGADAGIFTLNASVPLNFKANGVGFRCAQDI